ncbi:hypothetical protein [Candidatus Macondimonas diazotrophica]|jgi:hypothetical protein|uniref:Uncharacterized protein n=1 Tax=Candidatus Macondimonas diazotrophica TaxID=2305248 RepID=A0A4Z0F6T3_9GAMM|nr:hypothetical protein [Candidatus Macondimonas diazotrophica]TFZ81388.1 hypothetical protein E4680_12685 [Candidatus Macondimonas diazotrophica]
MAIQISSGLRNHMLISGSFKSGLDGGVLKIFAGAMPSTADADSSALTVLCTISLDATGTGITFASTVSAGILAKNASEIWRGQITATGTASFFRWMAISDTGALSTTEKRVQGTVGLAGADLNFSSLSFVSGNYKVIDSLNVALPLI